MSVKEVPARFYHEMHLSSFNSFIRNTNITEPSRIEVNSSDGSNVDEDDIVIKVRVHDTDGNENLDLNVLTELIARVRYLELSHVFKIIPTSHTGKAFLKKY